MSGIADLVERATEPGYVVVHPFVSGGSTAVACVSLGRRFVGSAADPAAVATTERRLRETFEVPVSGNEVRP